MELYQCPYNKSCKCAMTDPCLGCEDFKPSALEKQSKSQSNCNLPHVSVSLLSDLPENKPLYKDSGLWQLRTDDMDDVIIQQHSDESDEDFLEKCREIQREKERNER